MKQQLASQLAAISVTASDEQLQQLVDFAQLLQKWNRVYNLTALASEHDIVNKHFLDSLSISQHLQQAQSLLDVGTGGGFPGIPLAIVNPNKSFVLLDSNHKKTRFLHQAVATLGLKNVTVEHSRIEHYEHEAGFDVIMSRAFSSLKEMVLLTNRLLASGGKILAMKGETPDDVLPDEFDMHTITLSVPGTKSRHLVVVERVR